MNMSDAITEEQQERTEAVHPRDITKEMKDSYLNYSMSVIVGRALPDARDGLKPVHRRILYAMGESGMYSNKPFKKSARIVGDVMGKYHPHGDSAIYDTMVRMAQTFSLRYPLIDGQGNFGSVDGDPPAAMRYTESRLAKITREMLDDLEKDTVDFGPNYDGSMEEPSVLPATLPNMLINGSSGIAVGMATNMPPHNLREVCDGIIALIDDPLLTSLDLMNYIKGPDFPTAGLIYGRAGIVNAYQEGRGKVRMRARYHIEELKGNRKNIVITEIPYQVNKSSLLVNIAQLVKDKRVDGITDLRDESDKDGMRIVVQLRADVIEEVVMNNLFKHTALESTFGIINLAIVNGRPKELSLKQLLDIFIDHRKEIITRRTRFDFMKARKRAHLLEGLLVALDDIDRVLDIIRGSRDAKDALSNLTAEKFETDEKLRELLVKNREFAKDVMDGQSIEEESISLINEDGSVSLSVEQGTAILAMQLSKLTSLEREKIYDEFGDLQENIRRYVEILGSESEVLKIIREETQELADTYGDDRKTEINVNVLDIDEEDLIPMETNVVSITHGGYIKRMLVATYKQQRRGGKGLIGMKTKEEDHVVDAFVTSSHNFILFFTTRGRVFKLKAYHIPQTQRHSKGKAIINLLPELEKDEKIFSTIPITEFDDDHNIIFATKNGIIKKTPLSKYRNISRIGIIAIALWENDELVETKLTDGTNDIYLGTRMGQAIRFSEARVRPMGRNTHGVKGINLKEGDEVVAMAIIPVEEIPGGGGEEELEPDEESLEEEPLEEESSAGECAAGTKVSVDEDGEEEVVAEEDELPKLLTITENGYGKRSCPEAYRKTNRGGKGVITIITDERNGTVVSIKKVYPDEELLISTIGGMMIRIPVRQISLIGRATKGVTLMRMNEGDKVTSVAVVATEEEYNGEGEEGEDGDEVDVEEIGEEIGDEGNESAGESGEDPGDGIEEAGGEVDGDGDSDDDLPASTGEGPEDGGPEDTMENKEDQV